MLMEMEVEFEFEVDVEVDFQVLMEIEVEVDVEVDFELEDMVIMGHIVYVIMMRLAANSSLSSPRTRHNGANLAAVSEARVNNGSMILQGASINGHNGIREAYAAAAPATDCVTAAYKCEIVVIL